MKTKQITECGLLLALSLILSYLESLLPVMIAVPGVKLGLANIITMLLLYRFGGKTAFFFMTLKVILAGLLFSGVAGIIYSFAGGMCCIILMSIAKKCPFFSTLGVSMIGAMAHNAGQLVIALFVMENANILYYLPVLAVTGMITGMMIGYLSSLIYKQYMKIVRE